MKCLLVSDLHYALKQFDWVLSVAQDFDVVVIAGDHLDISSTVEARVQITVILTYLKRLHAKTRLVVSSGNHDLDARNTDGEKFAKWISKVRNLGTPTDGDCFAVGGTLFTICPWWDGPQTRNRSTRSSHVTRRSPRIGGSGFIIRPRTNHPRVGVGKSTSAMSIWCRGLSNTSRTSYSPATSISHPFVKAAPGWIGWVPRGSSTPGRQIGPCPHTPFSIRMNRWRSGSHWPALKSCD